MKSYLEHFNLSFALFRTSSAFLLFTFPDLISSFLFLISFSQDSLTSESVISSKLSINVLAKIALSFFGNDIISLFIFSNSVAILTSQTYVIFNIFLYFISFKDIYQSDHQISISYKFFSA